MTLPTIKECVQGTATFQFYRSGNLFYKTENDVLFPIPVNDTNDATFSAQDKGIFFMRWIKRHLDTMKNEIE